MTQLCDNCGTALSDDGGCQPCLLRMGLSHVQEEDRPELPPEVEELASHFPHLDFIRLVGRGGMGAIYQARQKTLDRSVAVKVIARDISGDTNFLERFEREAKTLGRLSHPNIVSVYDYGHTEDSQAYLLMEYIDGCNLREAMEGKHAGVDLPPVPDLIIKICEALAYAHSKGVVHRDVKPENILMGSDNSIKVADFGIAKIVDHQKRTPTLTATRQVLGSVNYLAPEHLDAPESVDHRVDLYAVGVMMYELLTGRLPIGRIESPSDLNAQIDHRYDEIVLKALAYDPQQRYQSAEEILEALRELSESSAPPVISPIEESVVPALSLPFAADAHNGFAQAVGVASFAKDEVKLEYRVRDAFFGSVKTRTKVIRIPASRLLKIDLQEHWYGSHLSLTADSITVFDEFPNAETGQLRIKVARADLPTARQAVKSVGTQTNLHQLQAAAQMTPEKASRWTTLGALFILSALINAGLLAVSIVFIANGSQGTAMTAKLFGIIMFSVLFGPVAVFQLIAGIICMIDRQPILARTAAIVSLLPIAPAWWLSGPTGAWALYWLNDSKKKRRLAPTQNWTSATVVLLRENRWARIVAISNAIGLLLAAGGFAIWQGGFYPSPVRYRIVDSTFHDGVLPKPQQTLLRPLIDRLSRAHAVEIEGNQLIVRGNRRERQTIIEALAIESPVELLALPLPDGETSEAENQDDTPGILGQGVSPEIREGQSVQLVASFVSSVLSDSAKHLTLELSQAGREAIQVLTPNGETQLVMVVDDVIVGLTTSKLVGKHMEFQIQSTANNEITIETLTAAIRGPAIPSDLELLN